MCLFACCAALLHAAAHDWAGAVWWCLWERRLLLSQNFHTCLGNFLEGEASLSFPQRGGRGTHHTCTLPATCPCLPPSLPPNRPIPPSACFSLLPAHTLLYTSLASLFFFSSTSAHLCISVCLCVYLFFLCGTLKTTHKTSLTIWDRIQTYLLLCTMPCLHMPEMVNVACGGLPLASVLALCFVLHMALAAGMGWRWDSFLPTMPVYGCAVSVLCCHAPCL